MIRAALRHRTVRLIAIGACTLALSGCISLLPKSKPVQLYHFGPEASGTAAPPAGAVGVSRVNGTFQREASGDRILTLSNGKAAYVAETRWVGPAVVLFDQAVLNAFEAAPGHVQLLSRGELGKSRYALRLDVRNFETRYEAGPKAAPTVVVRVRAALVKGDLSTSAEKIVEASIPATDNRVTAIVEAYGKATTQALSEIVAWTNANVPAAS